MFENIVGNEKNKILLQNIIKSKNISHSYLFTGPGGIGKFLFAKEFAKIILCLNPKNASCGICKSCVSFEENNHPDVKIIDEGNNSIKNEQIRELNNKILEKPIKSDKKIYIINNSENMTKEAQNSLLKTLEEPPEYAIIILICQIENLLLSTIKSRCTKIIFNKLANTEVKKILDSKDIDAIILKLCDGRVEKAEDFIEQQELYNNVNNIFRNLKNANILDFISVKEEIFSKENAESILDYINVIMYDLGYFSAISIVEKAKDKLSKNNNFDMTIDNFLFSIWEEING